MPKLNQALTLTAFIAAFIVVSYDTAHAYIDPGTGSYLLQILLAGLLGALFALKMFWRNVKVFVGNIFSSGSNDSNGEKTEDDQKTSN